MRGLGRSDWLCPLRLLTAVGGLLPPEKWWGTSRGKRKRSD